MLSADDIEAAFIETARGQVNGEPFDWTRLARLLNERLADRAYAVADAGARFLFAGRAR